MPKLIEKPFRKWSVWASIIFTTVWASVSGWWASLEAPTQQAILDDWNVGPSALPKLIAYVGLLAAVSTGVIGALRMIKQAAPASE